MLLTMLPTRWSKCSQRLSTGATWSRSGLQHRSQRVKTVVPGLLRWFDLEYMFRVIPCSCSNLCLPTCFHYGTEPMEGMQSHAARMRFHCWLVYWFPGVLCRVIVSRGRCPPALTGRAPGALPQCLELPLRLPPDFIDQARRSRFWEACLGRLFVGQRRYLFVLGLVYATRWRSACWMELLLDVYWLSERSLPLLHSL